MSITLKEIESVRENLSIIFRENSEVKLLNILKKNPFLFYYLFKRHYNVRPIFAEVPFGNYRCDFAWLNDDSDGPEWTLVEIEKPEMCLFKNDGDKTYQFNHAIEQVEHWRNYFNDYPCEKKHIFRCVKQFRYILVVGRSDEWKKNDNNKWRSNYNNENKPIEIRSTDVFLRIINEAIERPDIIDDFSDYNEVLPPSKLEEYVKECKYLSCFDTWY